MHKNIKFSTLNFPVYGSTSTAGPSVKNTEVKYVQEIAVLTLDVCMIVITSAIRNTWLE
jgi:hypothetical protein